MALSAPGAVCSKMIYLLALGILALSSTALSLDEQSLVASCTLGNETKFPSPYESNHLYLSCNKEGLTLKTCGNYEYFDPVQENCREDNSSNPYYSWPSYDCHNYQAGTMKGSVMRKVGIPGTRYHGYCIMGVVVSQKRCADQGVLTCRVDQSGQVTRYHKCDGRGKIKIDKGSFVVCHGKGDEGTISYCPADYIFDEGRGYCVHPNTPITPPTPMPTTPPPTPSQRCANGKSKMKIDDTSYMVCDGKGDGGTIYYCPADYLFDEGTGYCLPPKRPTTPPSTPPTVIPDPTTPSVGTGPTKPRCTRPHRYPYPPAPYPDELYPPYPYPDHPYPYPYPDHPYPYPYPDHPYLPPPANRF